MHIKRVFLGFEQPALWTAAEWLIERTAQGRTADLKRTIAVLPGGRAGRRLLEILVDVAERKKLLLSPPTIETVGHLPEQLYPLKRSLASDLTQQLAWANVLRKADRALLVTFIPDPPAADDSARWLELADMIRRQHAELAADGLDFGDVVKQGKKLAGFDETARWQSLYELQQQYLRLLDSLNLWDKQTARLFAIEHKECHTDRDIVLIGTADMNTAMRKMIDQVASRVTSLIFSPQDWAKRFDQHGCLIPEVWESVTVRLNTEQVELVEGHSEQADAVVQHLAEYHGKYRADEITIGVPDERIIPTLQRRLDEFSLPSRFGPGGPISETGPYKLLRAVAEFLENGRYVEFAALMRHPDVYAWLTTSLGEGNWLNALDQYQGFFLPASLAEDGWRGDNPNALQVQQAFAKVSELLRDLSGEQPLYKWSQKITNVLLQIYGSRTMNRHVEAERVTLHACETLHKILQSHPTVPVQLSPNIPAIDAIRFLLDESASERIPAPANETAIELLGWLELPLDDDPALIVTSFNEGFVPDSLNSDLFLPNSLRSHLKLEDNSRRFSRDLYAFATLVASRKRLHLIVGRRNADREPLVPSRLLFAADRETVAQRVLAFFKPPRESAPRLIAKSMVPGASPANFPIPLPVKHDVLLTEFPVSAFKVYLGCPYRYYLRYVQDLKAVADDMMELDGAAFGNLMHAVVKEFGISSQRDSTDPEEIRRLFDDQLNKSAAKIYGSRPLPAVAIQLEQLRARLNILADRQAEWAAQGWRIKHVEVPERRSSLTTLVVDGSPVQIIGRIDRIDYCEATGEWAILDYKTSDAGMPPDKMHRRKGEWTDLQLPMYRHYAKQLDTKDAPVRLGYVLLPKDTSNVEMSLAKWSDAELTEADDVARDVIRRVRHQEFWPPAEPAPYFAEDFAAICQDDVFDKWRPERIRDGEQ